jgi:hypothetical protein
LLQVPFLLSIPFSTTFDIQIELSPSTRTWQLQRKMFKRRRLISEKNYFCSRLK